MRLSSRSASRASTTSGSTRYRGAALGCAMLRAPSAPAETRRGSAAAHVVLLGVALSQAYTRTGHSATSVRCLALRAAALRRAIRQLRVPLVCFGCAQVFSHENGLRTGAHASLRIRSTPCGTTLACREIDPQGGQRSQFQALPHRRPNPSIERTSNGGAHWLASSRSVAPLAAAHVKR